MSAHTPSLYVTTQEVEHPEVKHTFRLPVTDTVPDGQEIIAVRPAGQFRFSSVLSPESLSALKSVARNR